MIHRATDRRGWRNAVQMVAVVCLVMAIVTPLGVAHGSSDESLAASHCSGTWSAQYVAGGQSPGYIKLNPGTQQQAHVQFKNIGSCTWTSAYAFLGTWNPEPGQDQASLVGGNGTNGGPNTGWYNYNRIAMLQSSVATNATADFYFNVKGPTTPGRYRLNVRPLIEGHTWMQDYGVWFEVQDQMTNSRYMNQVDPTKMYDLGCKLGKMDAYAPGTQDDLVVLDYGAPSYGWNGTAYEYGALYPGSATFVGISKITVAVEEFGHGFYVCARTTGAGDTTSSVRVAVGTSNGSASYTNYAHGQAWANMVNGIATYWVNQGFSGQVSPAGASDMELDWGVPAKARDWINGYASVNSYFLYDYGDAAGCRESGSTSTPGACDNTWTQEDVYWVSYAAAPSYPFPEFYNTGGAQARQWQQLKLYAVLRYGASYNFPIKGVMTQYEACQTNGPCSGTNNKPQVGLTQLLNAMNADSRTTQASVQWLTDVTWNNNPATNP